LTIEHRPGDPRGRFVLLSEGAEAGELIYHLGEGRLTILHTEVVPRLRGEGEAARLIAAAVDWARAEKLKVGARCSYAHAELVRTPAYADVLA
jgi:uncharacterized protein